MAVTAHWESSDATGVNGTRNDNSIRQAGAVYVFARTGSTWTQQAYIKASNTGRAVRQMLDCFADDLELADHGVLLHAIGHEGVATNRGVLLDVLDGVSDVTEVDAVVLHKGRASENIRVRSDG